MKPILTLKETVLDGVDEYGDVTVRFSMVFIEDCQPPKRHCIVSLMRVRQYELDDETMMRLHRKTMVQNMAVRAWLGDESEEAQFHSPLVSLNRRKTA